MIALRRVVAALLLLFLLTLSLFLLRSQSSSAPDFSSVSSFEGLEEVIVDVPQGASGSDIALLLAQAKVVKSSAAYFRVAVSDPRSEKVSPGKHRLTIEISARQALEQLLDTTRIPNLISVSEGAWRSEVEKSLLDYGFTSRQISNALRAVKLPAGLEDSEGVLFPAKYSFVEGTSALEAVQAMIDRFIADPSAKLLLRGSPQFSAAQLLTIASIVQAEGRPQDFAKVSQVIRNRLKIGMPLQMDATVHFALKARGDIFLSTKSTKTNSAYNTYRFKGLPPGPIGSPGSQAIEAALNPAQGMWLYFITVAPGDTRFTESFDQFNNWKRLYTANRKSGVFD